jgi:release factor glutamine methyltransferase
MDSTNKKALFREYAFEVCENVYEPAEDSFLFAENLNADVGTQVLDVGTGTGILGILAAKSADKVFALDINPYAIRCAKKNAILNKVDGNISFLQGDLFAPIAKDAKFSLILFNAPYLPSKKAEPESWLERAWAGGKTGRVVIDRFISQAAKHLEKTGEILLMQSNLANVEKTFGEFHKFGMKTDTVARLNLPFFETLFLLKATFKDP